MKRFIWYSRFFLGHLSLLSNDKEVARKAYQTGHHIEHVSATSSHKPL
jgi:hypothetical protein